jgi:hypothetical protein
MQARPILIRSPRLCWLNSDCSALSTCHLPVVPAPPSPRQNGLPVDRGVKIKSRDWRRVPDRRCFEGGLQGSRNMEEQHPREPNPALLKRLNIDPLKSLTCCLRKELECVHDDVARHQSRRSSRRPPSDHNGEDPPVPAHRFCSSNSHRGPARKQRAL